VCDNCHYAIHILIWHLANGGIPGVKGSRAQLALTEHGYERALAVWAAGKIPKEA
jgi:hypothetical protein